MNLPPGEYIVVGDHHANMQPNDMLLKVAEGPHEGKGMRVTLSANYDVNKMILFSGDIIDES